MSFTIEIEKQSRISFLINKLFAQLKKLPFLATTNQLLVEFINIFKAFYHLPISLVPSKHSLIDAFGYAQAEIH